MLAVCCVCLDTAQEPRLTSVYVDLSSDRCQTSGGLVLTIDDAPVAITRATPGPHPVSAVLLFDTSPSMLVQPIEAIARHMSRTVPPADRFVVGTFSPKVVFSKTTLTSEDAASRAAQVSQKQVGQGAFALGMRARSVDAGAYRHSRGRRLHGRTGQRNDRGYADVYDQFGAQAPQLWPGSATTRCQETAICR
jgi:hypothetical protein